MHHCIRMYFVMKAPSANIYIVLNVYVFTPLSEETIDYKTLLPPHYGPGVKEVGSRKMYIKNSPLSLFYNDEEVISKT
jgi:hypothetical protein